MPTTQVHRILVGLDGSPRSSAVLDTAISFARRHEAKLILFRAITIPVEITADLFKGAGDVTEHLTQKAHEYLAVCGRAAPPELLASPAEKIEVGTPWQAICTAATEEKADLIIIGSHGYSGLDRLLGTTAARIVNHAPCSVLVVRPRS